MSSLFTLLQNPEFRHLLVLSMLVYSLLHSVLRLGASLWRQKQTRRAVVEHGHCNSWYPSASANLCAPSLLHVIAWEVSPQMLFVVQPKLHPLLPGSLKFAFFAWSWKKKFRGEEVFARIDNENRGFWLCGVLLALIWDRNFRKLFTFLPHLAMFLAV